MSGVFCDGDDSSVSDLLVCTFLSENTAVLAKRGCPAHAPSLAFLEHDAYPHRSPLVPSGDDHVVLVRSVRPRSQRVDDDLSQQDDGASLSLHSTRQLE